MTTTTSKGAVPSGSDLEKASREAPADSSEQATDNVPPLRALSLLDRFLVIWIILAMAIGILLGNFVSSTGAALKRGEFVDVGIPIGTWFSKIIQICKCEY